MGVQKTNFKFDDALDEVFYRRNFMDENLTASIKEAEDAIK